MTQLAQLTKQLLQAKQDEWNAIDARRKIEADLLKLLPEKDEGTINQDEGRYRITVRFGITRKVDSGALLADWNSLGVIEQSAFEWKPQLKTVDYKALEKNPAAFAKVAKYVTATQAKPSISIKVMQEETA